MEDNNVKNVLWSCHVRAKVSRPPLQLPGRQIQKGVRVVNMTEANPASSMGSCMGFSMERDEGKTYLDGEEQCQRNRTKIRCCEWESRTGEQVLSIRYRAHQDGPRGQKQH